MSDPSAPKAAPPMPAKIGRYEIVRELGRGMMGVVFEARDPALGRRIALKTIQLAFAVSPTERASFEKRFFAEAQMSARLSHPGILVVHDVGQDPESGLLFIALEYLEGRTLADALEGGVPLDWREALRIVQGVASALHHAHAAGIVHRDIKPANIMQLPSGATKIMDFGIAKFEAAGGGLTSTGQFFGTPVYMAPEQAFGETVDGRADLFSLGATAYALLTGQLAFGAENVVAIIGRVTRHDPTPPSQVVQGIPSDVDYIVARALAKDRNQRYPDGKTMAEDIDDVLGGRAPRHRAKWMPPRRADGTMVSNTADFAPQPEPSIPAPPPSAVRAATPPSLPAHRPLPSASARTASAPPATGLRGGRATPPPSRAKVWLALLGVAIVSGGLAAALVFRTMAPAATPRPETPAIQERRREPPEEPIADRETAAPTAEPQEALPVEPSAAPPEPTPTHTRRAAEAVSGSGRLQIDFEHPLKSGTLKVWVDDNLVLDEGLSSRAKKIVAVTVRRGTVREAVTIPAGDHDIRVEVAWDDQRKTGAVFGSIEADETRTLEIRMPPVLKTVSVKWR